MTVFDDVEGVLAVSLLALLRDQWMDKSPIIQVACCVSRYEAIFQA